MAMAVRATVELSGRDQACDRGLALLPFPTPNCVIDALRLPDAQPAEVECTAGHSGTQESHGLCLAPTLWSHTMCLHTQTQDTTTPLHPTPRWTTGGKRCAVPQPALQEEQGQPSCSHMGRAGAECEGHT